MFDLSKYELGSTNELISLDSGSDVQVAVEHMLSQTHFRVSIYSRFLDPRLYGTKGFVRAMERMILSRRMAEVRIAVTDPGAIVRRGHRLLESALRLSSFIHIQRAPESCKNRNEDFIVMDEKAYLYRKIDSRFEATLNYSDRLRCHDLLGEFQAIWNSSQVERNIRNLGI
ncbi:MAG: DUF7931 domain-containing protein [Candidatus Eutrophobiaceae bacterium]